MCPDLQTLVDSAAIRCQRLQGVFNTTTCKCDVRPGQCPDLSLVATAKAACSGAFDAVTCECKVMTCPNGMLVSEAKAVCVGGSLDQMCYCAKALTCPVIIIVINYQASLIFIYHQDGQTRLADSRSMCNAKVSIIVINILSSSIIVFIRVACGTLLTVDV